MHRSILKTGLATTAVASFSGFAIGTQAVRDIEQLRDDRAIWNVARPVIEDAAANLGVASLATWLLILIVISIGVWNRAAIRFTGAGRADQIVAVTAASGAIAGALVWWSGAGEASGFSSLFDAVDASTALTVFNDYARFISGWQREAIGLLMVSAASLLALASPMLWRRNTDEGVLETDPPQPT